MQKPGFKPIDNSQLAVRRIGVGMLGYGFMGKVHSNAYLKIPYSFANPPAWPVLVAMCGRDEARVTDVASRFGYGGIYTDWKRLIADPDVEIFDNCTPDDRHAKPSIAAARAGKHVICEKPLAMTVKDAASMVEAAQHAGVKNMTCFNYRFIPAVRLARQLIEQGALGKIYHFRGCYLQEPGHDPSAPLEDCWYATGTRSGILLGIGSHIIDMARFLIGDEVEQVYAAGGVMVDPEIGRAGDIDTTVITLHFANGVLGTIDNSRQAVFGYDQRVEVFGSAGMVGVSNNLPDTAVVSDAQGVHGSLPLFFFVERYTEAYIAETKAFVACVLNDTPPPVTGLDGRAPVVMGYAANKSYREKRPVKLSEVDIKPGA